MEEPPQDDVNPFAAPLETEWKGVNSLEPDVAMSRTVKKFREQMHALGACWIVIATIALAVMLIAFIFIETSTTRGERNILLVVEVLLTSIGLAWLVIGILTCMKNMAAVYVGLVLSYISLMGNLLNFNVCFLLILIAVIVQSHRVIRLSKEIQAAGIPLTAKRTDLL